MAKHSAMDKRYTKFSTTFPLRPAWAVILTVGAVIFTAAAAPAADSAAVMRLEASSSKVYEGSAFKLLVHLDNTDAETPPDMSYLESEFQVEYLGPSRRNATRITIINGRQVKDEDKGITFAYALTPKSSGKIEIASPEMTVGGQTLSAPSVLIEVIPPNGQDLVELQLSADTDSVYPLVPFEVTLTVLVRELPGKYALRDPIRLIAGEVSPPVLGISWADDSTLPDSLKPAEPWDEWITRYQDQRQGGFSINGIRAGGMFDLSWAFGGQTQNLAMFLPQPQRIERANPTGGPTASGSTSSNGRSPPSEPGRCRSTPSRSRGCSPKRGTTANSPPSRSTPSPSRWRSPSATSPNRDVPITTSARSGAFRSARRSPPKTPRSGRPSP